MESISNLNFNFNFDANSRKRKGDGKLTSAADKRVKLEADIVCDICYQHFETAKHRQDHYAKKHLVRTGTYGCSSCGELHANEEEHRLHHDNVHKTKRVGYTCPICVTKVAYSLAKFETHVASCVDPFYSTVDIVDNILCAKCKCQFETRNLFDWHGCFIANKKPCMKCKRVFVKKATLWRHIFACEATPEIKPKPVGATHMVHIPNMNISAKAKGPKKTALPATKNTRPRKSQDKQVSVNFKAEPETILDPVGEASGNIYEPVTELQELLGSSGSAKSVHNFIVSPVEESDLFGFDDATGHFGDDGADSNADDSPMHLADTPSSLPPCTVSLEMINLTDFTSITINNVDMIDETEDGVAQSEEMEEQTAHESLAPGETSDIASEPSTSQAAEARHSLTMRIKREVMNPGYGDVAFNPVLARNIKREKSVQSVPVQRPNARKSTAKPTYTIIHSNLNAAPGKELFDPVLARNIKREKSAVNQPDAGPKTTPDVVTLPTAEASDDNVTGPLFDPVLARNIKREKTSDSTRISARKSTAKPAYPATTSTPAFDPILARNIKREKGVQPPAINTSTSSVNPIAGPSNIAVGSDSALFDPVLARNIKREKDIEKQQKSMVRPNPLAVASSLAANPTKVSKKMYKMALLAEKIRQERLARESGEHAALSTEETSNSSTSSLNVTAQSHTNNHDDASSSSTPLPTNAEEMDANESQSLPSESNDLLPAVEQISVSGLAEIIPFKPIRLSTDFRKLESSTIVSAEVAEVVDSSKLEVPFTISNVVSLTSIDAIESQSLESVTNENESENVDCDNRLDLDDTADDKTDTGTEAQEDETNESPGDETPVYDELESDKNGESASDEWNANDAIVEKSNEQIEEKSDINGNGHSSDILTNQTRGTDTDFQSEAKADKNNIMASLEAIEQIVTELEKSDQSLAAEDAANAENGNEELLDETDAQNDANDALAMEIDEAECPHDSDRIDQAEMEMSVIGSDAKLPNPSLATDECESNDLNEDVVRDNENAGSELLELLDTTSAKQPNKDMDCIENEIAENQGAAQANQGAVNTNLTDLDDISDDSMGFSEIQ